MEEENYPNPLAANLKQLKGDFSLYRLWFLSVSCVVCITYVQLWQVFGVMFIFETSLFIFKFLFA